MTELLSILNPVRILKVADFRKCAEIIIKSQGFAVYADDLDARALRLIERYETLTSQPLKKEMFVCGDEKPDFTGTKTHTDYSPEAQIKYTQSQEQVWFDGFELSEKYGITDCYNTGITIRFSPNSTPSITVFLRGSIGTYLCSKDVTVIDFIIEISRYNRTAKEPIKINFTESFCKQLIN